MSDGGISPIYYRVSPSIWRERAWTDDMRLLAFYLLTSPHRTLEGLFILPKGYIAGDLRWSTERLSEPFDGLLREGFLCYNEDEDVCLIIKALKYQRPENPNMDVSAARRIMAVPETNLDKRFIESAITYAERFALRLQQLLPQRFGKPQLYSALLNLSSLTDPQPVHNSGSRRAGGRGTTSGAPGVGDNGKSAYVCWRCGVEITDECVESTKGLRHKTCPAVLDGQGRNP